mmetsp:Transcript_7368/g.13688  ORF Transcript_7368/g.13688 Transcript_7368/m.13688 type:complete len:1034 (+) Transcript_7368:1283-4384(+)
MEQSSPIGLTLEDFTPTISKKQVCHIANGTFTEETEALEFKTLYFQFDVSFERDEDRHYQWVITRSYKDFKHFALELRRESWHKPLPKVPHLPKAKELRRVGSTDQLEMLEQYLNTLISEPAFCKNTVVWEFFEVSVHSFEGIDKKYKEGYVLKRTGGKAVNEKRCFQCSKYFRRFQRRWLLVRPNAIGYVNSNLSTEWHEALMFKNKFIVTSGIFETGYEDGIKIATSRRVMIIRTGSVSKRIEWEEAINTALQNSEWHAENNPNGSSFPQRDFCRAKSYVDAEGYYADVYKNLLKAERNVFISDWWLSPELYLLRPAEEYPQSQLLEVIRRIAGRGVQVYVNVYKELAIALPNDSNHTIKELRSIPGVKAVRHPHRSISRGEFLWSHHEKLIVIDYKVAFLGGLDLCFGRYDTNSHLLTDDGPVPTWLGIDYSNCRIADFTNVQNWKADSINRRTTTRMPWHDIAMQVRGKAAADVALHFIELWNHVMTDMAAGYYKSKNVLEFGSQKFPDMIKQALVPLFKVTEAKEEDKASDTKRSDDAMLKTEHDHSEEDFDQTLKRRHGTRSRTMDPTHLHPGERHGRSSGVLSIDVESLDSKLPKQKEKEDYIIPISQADAEIKQRLEKAKEQRSLSALMKTDSKAQAISELIFSKRAKRPEPVVRTSTPEEEEREERREIRAIIKHKEEEMLTNKFFAAPVKQRLMKMGSNKCQFLRSGGLWSIGLEETEHSIHTAYLNLIAQSQHFIYIENQFFISSTAGEPVKNQIAQALVERIKAAHDCNEDFKVIVVMPLLPAFEGAVDDPSASVLRIQLHWEYRTIIRGENSIYNQLYNYGILDPEQYIKFYGLRTHTLLNGVPQTEIVYVHSKLMIVDDTFAIMGSANINDRSMLGYNDSEIAMLVQDIQEVATVMAGKEFIASKFAYELRMKISKEFTGCDDEDLLRDPFGRGFKYHWEDAAERNTAYYNGVFECYPSDKFKKISQIAASQPALDTYEEYAPAITGFIVKFPLHFLEEEDLRVTIFNKEYFVPEVSFV